jgi:ribosomal protein S18 acetylase RimI-like enzyme
MKVYTHKWSDHSTVYIRDLAGFCTLNIAQELAGPVAYLYDLIVYPESRGCGQGRQLLAEAIRQAELAHCDAVVLWVDCEAWVKDWYQRNGFQPDPVFKSWTGETGWVKWLHP